MLQVRPFQSGDEPAIAQLILSIQQQEFGLPITLQDQPDLLAIEGFYQRGHGQFWVALCDGQVVGTVGLLDIGGQLGALRKMFVAASHRGRDWGVAPQLLAALLGWARGHGLQAVYLGTTDRFLAAHRFYEKQGFEPVAQDALPDNFPVMKVDSRFYRLGLSAVSLSRRDETAL